MRRIVLGALRLYQLAVSPYLRGYCRHTPSCSNYAYEAIVRHGAGKGVLYAIRRLGRCRPLGSMGYDPVP